MKNSRLLQAFDVFFIMILCFLTLLTTMLAQGRVLVGAGGSGEGFVYVLDLKILLPMFLILISYFFYRLPYFRQIAPDDNQASV